MGYLEHLGIPTESRRLPTPPEALSMALVLDACNPDNLAALLGSLADPHAPDSKQTMQREAGGIADDASETLDVDADAPIARLYFPLEQPLPGLTRDIFQHLVSTRPSKLGQAYEPWARAVCIVLSELRSRGDTASSLLRTLCRERYEEDPIHISLCLAIASGQDSELLEILEQLDAFGVTSQAWILRDALSSLAELDLEMYERVDEQDAGLELYLDSVPDRQIADWEVLADRDLAMARKQVAESAYRHRLLAVFDEYRDRWKRFHDLIARYRGVAQQDTCERTQILISSQAACRALAALPDLGNGRSLLARAARLTLSHNPQCTDSLLRGWRLANNPVARID